MHFCRRGLVIYYFISSEPPAQWICSCCRPRRGSADRDSGSVQPEEESRSQGPSTAGNYKRRGSGDQGGVFVLQTVTSSFERILMSLFAPSGR